MKDDVSIKILQTRSYIHGHTYLLMMILESILGRNDSNCSWTLASTELNETELLPIKMERQH